MDTGREDRGDGWDGGGDGKRSDTTHHWVVDDAAKRCPNRAALSANGDELCRRPPKLVVVVVVTLGGVVGPLGRRGDRVGATVVFVHGVFIVTGVAIHLGFKLDISRHGVGVTPPPSLWRK